MEPAGAACRRAARRHLRDRAVRAGRPQRPARDRGGRPGRQRRGAPGRGDRGERDHVLPGGHPGVRVGPAAVQRRRAARHHRQRRGHLRPGDVARQLAAGQPAGGRRGRVPADGPVRGRPPGRQARRPGPAAARSGRRPDRADLAAGHGGGARGRAAARPASPVRGGRLRAQPRRCPRPPRRSRPRDRRRPHRPRRPRGSRGSRRPRPRLPPAPAAPSFTSPRTPACRAPAAGAGGPGAASRRGHTRVQQGKPTTEGTPAGNNWEPAGNGWDLGNGRTGRCPDHQDGPPTQALPVRNGNGTTRARQVASGSTGSKGSRDDAEPRTPAAGGPSRLPAFGGAIPALQQTPQGPQAPQFPVGSQNIHGSDGPSAGSAANGAAGPGTGDAGRRSGDGPAGRPGAAAADLRLAGVRLVPAQRDDHDRPAAGAEQQRPRRRPARRSWTSPADEGWRAAQVVASPAAGETTQAGLPRRVPRANLVPGSVGSGGTGKPGCGGRSARQVGGRGPLPHVQLPARRARGSRRRTPDRGAVGPDESSRPRHSETRRNLYERATRGVRMSTPGRPAQDLNWLITNFVERVPMWLTQWWCPRTACCLCQCLAFRRSEPISWPR